MKKLIITLLSCLLVLGLVGCGNDKEEEYVIPEEPVVVTMPAIFFEGLSAEQLEAMYQPKGVTTITINEDHSVTMEIPAEAYRGLMQELGTEFTEIFNRMIDDSKESAKAFKKIEPNEDYSEFNIYVDKSLYNKTLIFAGLPILITSGIYQMFDGKTLETLDVTVNFVDEASNEVLEKVTLKEFFGEILK